MVWIWQAHLIREVEGRSNPNRNALGKLRFDLKMGRTGISGKKENVPTHSMNNSILKNHGITLQ